MLRYTARSKLRAHQKALRNEGDQGWNAIFDHVINSLVIVHGLKVKTHLTFSDWCQTQAQLNYKNLLVWQEIWILQPWSILSGDNNTKCFFHFLSSPSRKMLQMNHISGLRRQVKGSSFKPPKLVKVGLFTYNHSIRSHFPSMGFSATGGKIASMSPALIHMSHVSFVPPAQFSPLTESENGREWKLNTGPKLAHYMSIFTALIWRAGLGDSKERWMGWV